MKKIGVMDIVLYEGVLWVVSTAHIIDKEGRQLVNLARYNKAGYESEIPAYKCKIIQDEEDRKPKELTTGLYFYPDDDFA